MVKATAFTPETEISGRAMLSDIKNLRTTIIMPILNHHHMNNIRTDRWYPQQEWLNVLRDIASNPRTSYDYAAIGVQAAETIQFAPEINSVLAAFIALGSMYSMDHRNGDAGEITCSMTDEREVCVRARTPYPRDMIYGVIYGVARRFVPRDATLQVWQRTVEDVTYFNVCW